MERDGRPIDHAADREVIETQLGRPLRGPWRVAHRCHLGVPTVIESAPVLDDGTPFPTTFWLTCPLLVRRAGSLEAAGWMRAANRRLQEEPQWKGRVARSAAAYRSYRDSLGEIAAGDEMPGGGPERVKCVHAHIAHELARAADPVGALALTETGWPDCVRPCVEAAG